MMGDLLFLLVLGALLGAFWAHLAGVILVLAIATIGTVLRLAWFFFRVWLDSRKQIH